MLCDVIKREEVDWGGGRVGMGEAREWRKEETEKGRRKGEERERREKTGRKKS